MEVICSIIMTITQFTRDLSSLFVPLFPPFHSCHPTTKPMYKLVSSFRYLCSLHMNGNVEATLGFHHYVLKGISIQLSFVLLPSPSLISSLEGLVVFCPPQTNLGHVATLLFGYSLASQGGMCIQNLGSTTMSQKGFQFSYSSFGCFRPT